MINVPAALEVITNGLLGLSAAARSVPKSATTTHYNDE
jgi:hypothetical protein